MIGNETIGKANFFLENKVTVHVSCNSGQFYNGLIIEIVGNDFLLINDRMLGETPIYFSEIISIERFVEERK
jgi:hypothetical protein